jgi:hypothetical protein
VCKQITTLILQLHHFFFFATTPFPWTRSFIVVIKVCHTICLRRNKRGNVRMTSHWDASTKPALPRKVYYYIFLCMCACVCAYICVWLGARACACVRVGLIIQHATRMHHVVLSFVASLAPLKISTLSHKWRDFQEKVAECKMCVLTFSTTFFWNISHSKKNSVRYCIKCENVFM